jgi:hypothetical protein
MLNRIGICCAWPPKPVICEIAERLLDFFSGVHDEWTAEYDGLPKRWPAEH